MADCLSMKMVKLLIALLAGAWLAVPVFAQDETPMPRGHGMKMMKGMHEEMSADMKAMDEKLDKLVIDMNTSATPEKKLDAVIAVLNEMVAQHKKMHEKSAQRWERRHPMSSASPTAEEKKE